MNAIIIRNLDNNIYSLIKEQSKKAGISINKFIIECLKKILLPVAAIEHHDFDVFFGSWDTAQHKQIKALSTENRKIDKELWK
ncbi:MAG: hypothetical protein ACD_62C00053G0004 [uncultured bacterium]|nr:MAG: hypothetical protein ACD_62C00053G0004 [uncultured bacterium]